MTNYGEASKHFVTSTDGTQIGYLRQGSGPGLVLVQGAMGTASNYAELAQVLSTTFTVIRPDRRGRGMSPKPYSSQHSIARDVEDLDAILAETGASLVFGLSSVAMITLEATRTLARITRACVYEPPFYPDGISHEGIRKFSAEIEKNDLSSALLTAGTLVGLTPTVATLLPKAIAKLGVSAVLVMDDCSSEPYAKLRELLPAMRYDFNVVGGREGTMEGYAAIPKPMLLISGTKSPDYLRQSIRKLQSLVPQASHVELQGLDHSGAWNVARGGKPEAVAEQLKVFFG